MESGRGGGKPLLEGSQRGGYPLIPPLFEGANGLDRKACDPGYKRLDWCRTHFVRSWSFKMADFPVLLDDVLLMIGRSMQRCDNYPGAPNESRLSTSRGFRSPGLETSWSP